MPKGKFTSVSVTGLFKAETKPGRSALYTGTCSGEYLDQLIAVIKKARAAEKGVTFFLWKSDPGYQSAFNLKADVERERAARSVRGARPKARPIEEDEPEPEAEEEPTEEPSDPFEED